MANDRIRIEVQGDSDDLEAALRRSRESIKGVGDESDRQTTRAGRVFDRLRAKLAKPIKAKVEAETKHAESRLEGLHARIKQIEREKLEIKASADTTQVDAQLGVLRGEIKKLEREKIKPDADVAAAEAKIQGLLAQVEELNRQRLNIKARADTSEADANLRKLRSEVAGVRSEMARLPSQAKRSFGGVGGAVGKVNQSFQLLRNGMRLLRWPLIATGAGIATQALSAATAGAAGLLGALGPLSGAFAAIPAFAGAAAQGMGVWKLATGGITAALGGLNEKLADTKAQKAAFKGLSDEAKDFARDLEKMKPKILGLQHIAQRGLLPGLREGLREAMKNFPVVERVIARTAATLGKLAAQAGKALGSAEWGRDLETIGTRNAEILYELGKAAGNVANALRHVAVASGPAMKGLAQDVVGLTEKLEKAAEAGRKSGRLGAFFDRARERAHKVAGILGNVASGLLRILTLGNRHMGGPLLDDLAKVSKRFNEWTKSARGQNAIATYFKKALPGVRELGRTIAAVGKAFLRIGQTPGIEKTLKTVRTRLIPALEKMLTTMAGVAGPEVVNALAAIADLFAALSPYVAHVAKFVALAAGGLADLIRLEPGVGLLVGGMLAFGTAVKALKFVGAITGLTTILSLIRGIRTAAPAAAAGMGGIAARNAALAGGGGLAAGAAGGAAGGGAMAALKRWGGRALKFAGGKAFLPVAITFAVGALLGGKLGRYSGKKGWGNLFDDVKVKVDFVGRKVGEVWRSYDKAVRKAVNFVGRKVGAVWRDTKKAVRKAVQFIGRTVGSVWRSAKAKIRKAVDFIAQRAGGLWRSAKDVWKKVVKFLGETAGDLWKKAKDVWGKTIKFVSKATGDLWKAAKKTWDKTIKFIGRKSGSLWQTAGRTITKVVRFVGKKLGFAEGGIAGFAAGGTPTPTDDFAGAPTRKSTGGRHSRPTYLVGEENRPEFVIATNPAYRKANLEYLSMAAAALKAPMVPAFAGGGILKDPTAGFAKGGRIGSFNADDRANFQYGEGTPRARRWRGQMRVRGPRGGWIEPLRYRLEAARERESFYGKLSKNRGGRSSREWHALSRPERRKINNHWEGRSDRVGKLHEEWEQRFEALNELWGQLTELRGVRRGQRALGRRVQGAQLGVMRDFAGQYVGRYAQGGPISLPRRFGSSGIAEVHRGERVVPDPRGAYGSQVAVAGQGGPVKVDVTIGFDDRGMLKIVDQRIEGRAADVSSREIGRRTRRLASAPGARRPAFAR